MPIKQTVTFNIPAEAIYHALLNADEFSNATGAPAEIAEEAGGAFSCFGGQITGRHIELVPYKRIVQAWRAGAWEDGIYSIVKIDIDESDGSTVVDLEHSGFPEAGADHLNDGWHKMYWDPLKKYLG